MTSLLLRAAAWGLLSLAEMPLRAVRAAANTLCPPDTHDVFPEEER